MIRDKQIQDLGFRTFRTIQDRNNFTGVVYPGMKALVYADALNSNNGVYVLQSDLISWILEENLFIRESFTFSGGRDKLVTDSYLNNTFGVSTNISPYVTPVNASLWAASVSTSSSHTYSIDIRRNLSTVANISVTSAQTGYNIYNVDIDAGDGISFYLNGSEINDPMITIFLRERI